MQPVKNGDYVYQVERNEWNDDDRETYSMPTISGWMVISVCDNGDPIVVGTVFSNGCHQITKRVPLKLTYPTRESAEKRVEEIRAADNARFLANKARAK